MGKKENRYVRELVDYYNHLGVEKFVFADNNLPNTEKFSDVLQDYIDKGLVDIIDIIGKPYNQGEFYGILYEKYKYKCEWLIFFDFDEYLVMHFEENKKISLHEYLSSPLFKNCQAIKINWLMYTDNDLVYYDNRTLVERFTKPLYSHRANRFVKSIVRGNISEPVFIPNKTHHSPNGKLNLCDSMGKSVRYTTDFLTPPRFKYAFLMHFNTRTAEEYVEKMRRGHANYRPYGHIDKRVDMFFEINKFTQEKLKIFEEKFNRTFPKYHNKKYYNETTFKI